MKKLFMASGCLAILVGLVGCVTTGDLQNVSVGMTKSEAIKIMGDPDRISAKDQKEYLIYSIAKNWHHEDFFIRLSNGRVDSYGQISDFKSIEDQVNNINLNEKKESAPNN